MKDTLAPDDFYSSPKIRDAVARASEAVNRFDGIPDCADGSCKACHRCYLDYLKQLREREV